MTMEDLKAEIEVAKSRAPEPNPEARRRKLRKIGGLIAGAAAVGSVLAGLTGYWTTYRMVTKEILAPANLAPAEIFRLFLIRIKARSGGTAAQARHEQSLCARRA
jgi:hypothetical protein